MTLAKPLTLSKVEISMVLAKPLEVKPEHELVLNFGYERNKDGTKKNAIPTVFYNERYIEVAIDR